MVISVAPTAIRGVTDIAATRQKAARPLSSRATKRSRSSDRMAAMIGEKNRTPNALSPHSAVPRNCV